MSRISPGSKGTGSGADDAFDLIDLVESVVGPLAAQATAKGIDLVSSVAADVPRAVRGDAGRLRQVLTTLIDNAVKFTDQGGVSLSLTASPTGRGAADGAALRGRGYGHRHRSAAAHTRVLDGAAGNGMASSSPSGWSSLWAAPSASTALPESAATSGSWSRWNAGRRNRRCRRPGFQRHCACFWWRATAPAARRWPGSSPPGKPRSMRCPTAPRPWLPP